MTLEYYKAAPLNETYKKHKKKPKEGQLELFTKEEMGPVGQALLNLKALLHLN